MRSHFCLKMKIPEKDFPLFPLNTVLFPQARLPLYIFEPRYQEMINRCLEEDLAFGVLLIKEGGEVGAPAAPHSIGTAARIVDVARGEDGRMNISVLGVTRFRLIEPSTQRAYLTGRIQLLPDENVDLSRVEFTVRRTARLFKEYVKRIQAISEMDSEDDSFQLPKDPTHLSYLIASNLPISNPDRQTLLEAKTVKDRLRREILFLERELSLLRLVTDTSDRVRDQGSFSLN